MVRRGWRGNCTGHGRIDRALNFERRPDSRLKFSSSRIKR